MVLFLQSKNRFCYIPENESEQDILGWNKSCLIRKQSTPPMPPTHPTLIPPTLPPKMLSPLTLIPHIHWEIANSPPTPPTPWKTRKEGKQIDDKVTINNTLYQNAPGTDTPNASAQYAGSADSNSPYSLGNCKFAAYSITTMKNQKKKENQTYDKGTFDTPHAPDAPGADTPNTYAQYSVSTDSYLPH